jgi:hypothetical protein
MFYKAVKLSSQGDTEKYGEQACPEQNLNLRSQRQAALGTDRVATSAQMLLLKPQTNSMLIILKHTSVQQIQQTKQQRRFEERRKTYGTRRIQHPAGRQVTLNDIASNITLCSSFLNKQRHNYTLGVVP